MALSVKKTTEIRWGNELKRKGSQKTMFAILYMQGMRGKKNSLDP